MNPQEIVMGIWRAALDCAAKEMVRRCNNVVSSAALSGDTRTIAEVRDEVDYIIAEVFSERALDRIGLVADDVCFWDTLMTAVKKHADQTYLVWEAGVVNGLPHAKITGTRKREMEAS